MSKAPSDCRRQDECIRPPRDLIERSIAVAQGPALLSLRPCGGTGRRRRRRALCGGSPQLFRRPVVIHLVLYIVDGYNSGRRFQWKIESGRKMEGTSICIDAAVPFLPVWVGNLFALTFKHTPWPYSTGVFVLPS